MKKSISIFGVTGSVGNSTIELLRKNKSEFDLVSITCNEDIDKIISLAKEFDPKIVAIANKKKFKELKKNLPGHIKCLVGTEGICEAASYESDIVIASIVGLAGLRPLIESIKSSSIIALANKECVVSAGSLIKKLAKKNDCKIIPIDSEHNAIFQILDGKSIDDVSKIFLTASGGPFYNFSEEDMKNITPKQAINHPVWKMGKKISVDSATLMNKGLEIIEAHYLFELPSESIDVIIHRQSIIHGLVLMKNGSLFGHFGRPSMLNPIDHALSWPKVKENKIDPISISDLNNLSVEIVDETKYKSISLSRLALEKGGNLPIFLNAANEIAVNAFLNNKIQFLDIVKIIDKVIEDIGHCDNKTLETISDIDGIFSADNEARRKALESIELGF
ncbi:MAG: 1-deoxy-D-xylulose-5-phosphate reductoisomerase [Hyphomicrobiales bacterium]